MDTDGVMRWVAGYEKAWRGAGTGALADLFTEDATYSPGPYEPLVRGLDAIREFWPEPPGTTFTVEAEPVAVQGGTGVVRLRVEYLTPDPQEYLDLWVLRFAPDGRVAQFEEWPFWPGREIATGD